MLPATLPRSALAVDTVRYVGEPIVAVVAETRSEAIDAAEIVIVDYDIEDAVVTIDDALRGDVLLFPDLGTNVCVAAAVEPGPARLHRVRGRRASRHAQPTSRPLADGESASPRHAGSRTAGSPIGRQARAPTRCSDRLCEWYGWDAAQVRVITPDVGGGFGAKAFTYPEDMLLPWIARRVGRPVRYTETRSES